MELEFTAKGSGYYRVYVSGVEKSQHIAEREAIESASNLVLSGEQNVTYKHDYEVSVVGTGENVGESTGQNTGSQGGSVVVVVDSGGTDIVNVVFEADA